MYTWVSCLAPKLARYRIVPDLALDFVCVGSPDRVNSRPLFEENLIGGSLMSAIIAKINQEQMKSDVAQFNVGDAVRVHTRVVEGDKERIQIYSGIVIGRKGTLMNQTLTVRRISYGEGVERVFPIHSPRVAKIEVETAGTARRAKLTYLRKRKGKSAMAVREKARV
jgi:large subunit ribosomal protein L19